MSLMVSELLFYGGAALAGCSLAAALVVLFVYRKRASRLNALFDKEYGEEEQSK